MSEKSKKQINRRDFLRLASLVSGGAILAACAPQATAAPTAPAAPAATAQPASPTSAAAAPATAVPTEAPQATTVPGANVSLTVWYWGDPDAPGADKWLAETATKYMAAKPNVKVEIVTQDGSTLFSALQTAASSGTGPDIGSQWATGPVMDFVWSDALVPVSDYIPADELKHYLNTSENTVEGKVWGSSLYLVGVRVIYNKDMFQKANVTAPGPDERWSWDQFMAACASLKTAGLVPFGAGNKDGYSGAWFFSNMGMQGIDTTEDLRQAVIGNAKFTDDKYTGWYKLLDDMVKKGYFNTDVMSMDHAQSFVDVSGGKTAMQWGIDGVTKQTLKDMDPTKVGVMKFPKWGMGKLADYGNVTQSTSYLITKWSKAPQEAANFIMNWHSAERMSAWFAATGVVPADDRFDASVITDPVMQTVAKWNVTGPQVWLENWIPGQVDNDGDLAAGQMVFAQSGTPADEANLWEQSATAWRNQNPVELDHWKSWKQS
jgi:multiple sugar transport system substrate-binding protein